MQHNLRAVLAQWKVAAQSKDEVLTWSHIIWAKIHNSLQWISLLSVKIINPVNKIKGQSIHNNSYTKSLRIVGSTLNDLSFRSRWSHWCPFLVMASVFRSHFRVSSKIVPKYLYEWTISTFSSSIWIALRVCPGLLKSTIISLRVHEDVPLEEIMYLVCMPGEYYGRRLRALLLYLYYVFRALINSLVCWYLKFCSHSDHSTTRHTILLSHRGLHRGHLVSRYDSSLVLISSHYYMPVVTVEILL